MKKLVGPLALMISCSSYSQVVSDSTGKWSVHFQLTSIAQGHFAFPALYSGANSLKNTAEPADISLTSTLFLGRRIWKNGVLYGNAEISGGKGMSATKGVAGFPNGETYRIGNPAAALYLARLYLQQDFSLSGDFHERQENAPNQLAQSLPSSRVTIIAGKFSNSDFFDNNTYSHDPRTQFMNWGLMSNAAWDYAANTRGYTSGLIVELFLPRWEFRASCVAEPKEANSMEMDYDFIKSQGLAFEAVKKWLGKRPGAIRLLGFRNSSRAPSYSKTIQEVNDGDSINLPIIAGEQPGIQYGGIKYGFGINAEQSLSRSVGAFAKASWNDGKTATWAFTEIDRTISAGVNVKADFLNRPGDNLGLGAVINGISRPHREFLQSGFYGFIIGDGNLRYGAESIIEAYYEFRIDRYLFLTADYQFINNPGYNKDRGPVSVYGLRVHVQF
jgi:high affinity Mn2+ porin